MTELRACTLADLLNSPNFPALVAEYAEESRLAGLPPPNPHFETYDTIERAGLSRMVAAYEGENLVGFAVVLFSLLPHYGVRMAHVESFFVGAQYRKHGHGLRLLDAVEEIARQQGALGLFASAAIGGRLDSVLAKRDNYHHTHNAYLRVLT